MDKYFVLINNNKYNIPRTVSAINEDIFIEYSYELEEEGYLDLAKLIKEDQKEKLETICNQSLYTVRELVEDTPEKDHSYHELVKKVISYDDISKIYLIVIKKKKDTMQKSMN